MSYNLPLFVITSSVRIRDSKICIGNDYLLCGDYYFQDRAGLARLEFVDKINKLKYYAVNGLLRITKLFHKCKTI